MANKYKNKKVVIDGIQFDSKKEGNHWLKLKALEEQGKITDLQRQVKFTLLPAIYETVDFTPRGKPIKRCVERAVTYTADFAYKDSDGKTCVEDTKSAITAKDKVYIIKRKLMKYVHNITLKEVRE